MIKKKLIGLLTLSALVFKSAYADINSATITAATLKATPNCLHYKVRGTCYWLSDWDVTTTPYVEHYLPDVVVTVFNKPGDNPWTEMKLSIDKAGAIAEQKIISSLTGFEAGVGQHSFADQHEQSVFFKETDVVGNPAISLFSAYYLLPSTASSLTPYYQSMLDAALWRGLPQIPTALAEEDYAIVADMTHHIGTGLINWGGVYPHEGKVSTNNDAKAAAVMAQRASDLITSTDLMHLTGHIYQSLSNSCGEECNAAPVQENSEKTQFQMIYPTVDLTCDYFGKTVNDGEDRETKAQGAYAWVIWRKYEGCRNGDGQFMGETLFN